jgi:hypothetical protein
MQVFVYELRRMPLPRTRVNRARDLASPNDLTIERSWPHRARQGRLRSSATSEGPEVLPVLTSHHASSTSRAPHLPISSSQSPQGILSHTFSQNPTNPTIVGVSGISKVFIVVGFKLLTRRCSR